MAVAILRRNGFGFGGLFSRAKNFFSDKYQRIKGHFNARNRNTIREVQNIETQARVIDINSSYSVLSVIPRADLVNSMDDMIGNYNAQILRLRRELDDTDRRREQERIQNEIDKLESNIQIATSFRTRAAEELNNTNTNDNGRSITLENTGAYQEKQTQSSPVTSQTQQITPDLSQSQQGPSQNVPQEGPEQTPDQQPTGPDQTPDQQPTGPDQTPDQQPTGPDQTPEQQPSGPDQEPTQDQNPEPTQNNVDNNINQNQINDGVLVEEQQNPTDLLAAENIPGMSEQPEQQLGDAEPAPVQAAGLGTPIEETPVNNISDTSSIDVNEQENVLDQNLAEQIPTQPAGVGATDAAAPTSDEEKNWPAVQREEKNWLALQSEPIKVEEQQPAAEEEKSEGLESQNPFLNPQFSDEFSFSENELSDEKSLEAAGVPSDDKKDTDEKSEESKMEEVIVPTSDLSQTDNSAESSDVSADDNKTDKTKTDEDKKEETELTDNNPSNDNNAVEPEQQPKQVSEEYVNLFREVVGLLNEKISLSNIRNDRTDTILSVISDIGTDEQSFTRKGFQLANMNQSFANNYKYEESLSSEIEDKIKMLEQLKNGAENTKEFDDAINDLTSRIAKPNDEKVDEYCRTILEKQYMLENMLKATTNEETITAIQNLMVNLDTSLKQYEFNADSQVLETAVARINEEIHNAEMQQVQEEVIPSDNVEEKAEQLADTDEEKLDAQDNEPSIGTDGPAEIPDKDESIDKKDDFVPPVIEETGEIVESLDQIKVGEEPTEVVEQPADQIVPQQAEPVVETAPQQVEPVVESTEPVVETAPQQGEQALENVVIKGNRLNIRPEQVQNIDRVTNLLQTVQLFQVYEFKKKIVIMFNENAKKQLEELKGKVKFIIDASPEINISSEKTTSEDVSMIQYDNIDGLNSIHAVVEADGQVVQDQELYQGRSR